MCTPLPPRNDDDDSKDPAQPDETDAITNSVDTDIKRVCRGMSRYYSDHNVPYSDIVSNHCDENGYDDLNDDDKELKDDLLDILLPTFPFTRQLQGAREDRKRAHVWDLMQSFVRNVHPGRLPRVIHTVQFLGSLFDSVTGDDFKRSRERYKTQCAAMWKREMQVDHGFMFALAIGDKMGFPFLQFLVDDFLCTKANRQRFPDGITVKDWASKHNRYMKALKEHNIQVHIEWMEEYVDNDGRSGKGKVQKERQELNQSAFDLMVHAIYSWCKRCVQDWKPSHYRIDDNMEDVMEILSGAVQWMANIMENWDKYGHTSCPMQLDVSVVFDAQKVRNEGMQ